MAFVLTKKGLDENSPLGTYSIRRGQSLVIELSIKEVLKDGPEGTSFFDEVRSLAAEDDTFVSDDQIERVIEDMIKHGQLINQRRSGVPPLDQYDAEDRYGPGY